eukprot:5762854-Amphidinium_carterae.1
MAESVGSPRCGLPLYQKPDVELDAIGGLRDSQRAVSKLPILTAAGRALRREILRVVSSNTAWADEVRQ